MHYSREILALYVEDDLPSQESMDKVESHISGCAACRQYCEQLRKSQSFIKSRFEWSRQAPVNQATLTRVRQSVMSQIPAIQESAGWMVRFERFLTLGLRRHRYALAGFAFAAIISASLLGQIRHPAEKEAAAVFGARIHWSGRRLTGNGSLWEAHSSTRLLCPATARRITTSTSTPRPTANTRTPANSQTAR